MYHHVCSRVTMYEHGDDSVFHRAVEPDSLIAVLWHFSGFAD